MTTHSTGTRLSAYLNDHLSDETLGVELARRAGGEHKGTQLGTFLEILSWELEEDRDTLVDLMGELGVDMMRDRTTCRIRSSASIPHCGRPTYIDPLDGQLALAGTSLIMPRS